MDIRTNLPPYSWETLSQNIKDGRLTIDLYRTREGDKAYQRNRAYVQQHYLSYADYIRIKYLNCEAIAPTSQVPFIRSQETSHTLPYAMVPNSFPYHTQPGIHHYILWSMKSHSPTQIESIIRHTFGARPALWFVNEPCKRSVPQLWHAHVFWH